MLLQSLLAGLKQSLDRLEATRLDSYDQIQRSVRITDVRSDTEFQRTFGGYYRVRRPQPWRERFYALLEREKWNSGVSFSLVLGELYETTGSMEASFGSKLVATVRPDQPVYDRFVREALCLRVPPRSFEAKRRLSGLAQLYEELGEKIQALISTVAFEQLRAEFDIRFSAYRHFTDVKKLDLLLWQHRGTSRPNDALERAGAASSDVDAPAAQRER